MNKTLVLTIGLLATMLAAAPLAVFADEHNFLKDPSFELRLAAAEGGWTLFEESLISNDNSRTGDHSMLNAGMSRTVAFPPYFVGTVSGAFQEFPAEAGSRWQLTGYGMVPNAVKGAPAFGIVQVSFFDAKGKDLGTVETADSATRAKTSAEVNSQSVVGEWILLDTGVATAPEGTAAVQAFTIYVDFSGSNTTQGVYFDDLTLCALDDIDDGSGPCGEE